MDYTVQVFLQLREADRYARAKNPLLRRMAVVLLDNLVELQLGRMSRGMLYRDRTTWYSGVRRHNRKVRHGVKRLHHELVAFAQKQGWITKEDGYLLKFAHDVRNRFYHEGAHEKLDCELAIRLLYRFVKKYFPAWRAENRVTRQSPYEPIHISEADDDATGFKPLYAGKGKLTKKLLADTDNFHSLEYWAQAIPQILSYKPKDDIRSLIYLRVEEFINELDNYRSSLVANKDLDFNWVVGQRFAVMTPQFTKNIRRGKPLDWTGALNIYLAILRDHNEEKLLDMKVRQRSKEFFKIVNNHKQEPNALSSQKITGCRMKAKKIPKLTEEEGIGIFLAMENELLRVRLAMKELAYDLEEFWQQEADMRRGK